MTNKTTGGVTAAILGVVSAILVLLKVFNVTHLSDAETAVVTTEAATTIALIGAAYAHFRKGTAKEPVALFSTFSAWCSASVATVAVFVSLTGDQSAALIAVSAAVVTLLTAIFVRGEVTPMKFAPDAPDAGYLNSLKLAGKP